MHDSRIHANQNLRVSEHSGNFIEAVPSDKNRCSDSICHQPAAQRIAAGLIRGRCGQEKDSSWRREPSRKTGPIILRPLALPALRTGCPRMEDNNLAAL
jgi:hypothetical protein